MTLRNVLSILLLVLSQGVSQVLVIPPGKIASTNALDADFALGASQFLGELAAGTAGLEILEFSRYYGTVTSLGWDSSAGWKKDRAPADLVPYVRFTWPDGVLLQLVWGRTNDERTLEAQWWWHRDGRLLAKRSYAGEVPDLLSAVLEDGLLLLPFASGSKRASVPDAAWRSLGFHELAAFARARKALWNRRITGSEGATTQMQELLKRCPGNPVFLFDNVRLADDAFRERERQGFAVQDSGRDLLLRDALAVFHQLPEHPRAVRLVARLALDAGMEETAWGLYRHPGLEGGKDGEKDRLTALFCRRMPERFGGTNEALKIAEQAMQSAFKNDGDIASLLALIDFTIDTAAKYTRAGLARPAASQWTLAKRSLDRARGLDGGSPWVYEAIARFYLHPDNRTYFSRGVALGAMGTALQYGGDRIPAILLRAAKIYYYGGNFSMAWTAMNRVIQLSDRPDYAAMMKKLEAREADPFGAF